MAEINLEDLMKAKRGDAAEAAPAEAPAALAETVARQVAQLTPEERQKVEAIKEKIDLTDARTALTFGAPAQKEIADFSEHILSEVRTKDAGPVGELLTSLVTDVRAYDAAQQKGFLEKIPFVGGLAQKVRQKKAGYDKLSAQVSRIEAGLEQARLKMMKDVALFDGLYEKNLAYFKDLQLYITAGEEKLREMQEQTLPKLRAQAAEAHDPMAVQVVADFEQSVARFEKKVHDLKLSRTIAIQTAPQIRLIQNNDKALIDRVQTAIYSTIPLWKNQLVIALGLASQRQVLDMQRAVSDTTNELLERNAALLKANTLETAAENERGVVDIATVKKVNEELIATNEEMMFVTAFIGVLEVSTGTFRYVNCGHNPLFRYTPGQGFARFPQAKNCFLGVMDGMDFTEQTMEIAPGGYLYMYTDGVTEAMNVNHELYAEDRLEACLNRLDMQDSLENMLALVRADIAAHVADAPQSDDITMLMLRRDVNAES